MAQRSSSKVGKLLFGSLTASTVGLGTWQTLRFLEEKPEPSKLVVETNALQLDKAVLVGPRTGGPSKKKGYYVYVPATSQNMLVCIGWTPNKVPDMQASQFTKDAFEVFTRPGEQGNRFSPENPPSGPFLWIDEKKMLAAAGLEPSSAQLGETYEAIIPEKLSPKAMPEPYLTKWTHAGYAATWYSLSIAGVLMMRKMFK